MDQLIIERDVPLTMDDGLVLRADVFRPKSERPAPVIMTLGPYGKGLRYSVGYAGQWAWMMKNHPDVLPGSTHEFMNWETVDPEIWVPWGYVCVRVDSRGAGRSPGFMDLMSEREILDFYHAIEWAGTQPWSSGKVGLSGISYYAINQWRVASLQPPHLTAMIPWEGAADSYRDNSRQGGIASNAYYDIWYRKQIEPLQHGNPRSYLDPWLKDLVTGPDILTETKLAKLRKVHLLELLARPLDDEYYRNRSPIWEQVTVPFLSAGNWGGWGQHGRGNTEGYVRAASKQKWLQIHPGRHEEWFYLDQGVALQKRFLDHFLKGEDNGWDKEPPVFLHIRRPFSEDFPLRKENAWPLPSTKWTTFYLDAADNEAKIKAQPAANATSLAFEALGTPLTFRTAPIPTETEITGPLSAKIYASSTTTDMDLFLTLQAFSADGIEVDFQGAIDPHTPLSQGCLRASHRKLDTKLTKPYRPYHTHDEEQPLEPGKIYELDIELWPTCIILPAGFTLSLQIAGKDFEREVPDGLNEAWVSKGSGPFLHNDPYDRPVEKFGGKTTIYTGGETTSSLLLPIIAPRVDETA
jgi:predicted acyl esterase